MASKKQNKNDNVGVWNKQHGGSHYQKYVIQPSKFVVENKLLYPEGCAIKYIIRHQDKGKKQDLLKAIHFIEMIIERDYLNTEDRDWETTYSQPQTCWAV